MVKCYVTSLHSKKSLKLDDTVGFRVEEAAEDATYTWTSYTAQWKQLNPLRLFGNGVLSRP